MISWARVADDLERFGVVKSVGSDVADVFGRIRTTPDPPHIWAGY